MEELPVPKSSIESCTPHLVQLAKDLDGVGRVGHDGAFGDLDHQQPRRDSPVGQQPGHLVRKVEVE
jgi:hypothetical protein